MTRANVQALTGLTPDQFLAEVNAFLAGFGTFTAGRFLAVHRIPAPGPERGVPGSDSRRAAPFKTPYNNTFTVGGERTVVRRPAVGATYVHR